MAPNRPRWRNTLPWRLRRWSPVRSSSMQSCGKPWPRRWWKMDSPGGRNEGDNMKPERFVVGFWRTVGLEDGFWHIKAIQQSIVAPTCCLRLLIRAVGLDDLRLSLMAALSYLVRDACGPTGRGSAGVVELWHHPKTRKLHRCNWDVLRTSVLDLSQMAAFLCLLTRLVAIRAFAEVLRMNTHQRWWKKYLRQGKLPSLGMKWHEAYRSWSRVFPPSHSIPYRTWKNLYFSQDGFGCLLKLCRFQLPIFQTNKRRPQIMSCLLWSCQILCYTANCLTMTCLAEGDASVTASQRLSSKDSSDSKTQLATLLQELRDLREETNKALAEKRTCCMASLVFIFGHVGVYFFGSLGMKTPEWWDFFVDFGIVVILEVEMMWDAWRRVKAFWICKGISKWQRGSTFFQESLV